MDPSFNPYAPPTAAAPQRSEIPMSGVDCWRDGQDLVLSHAATLPERCVKCNRRAETPIQQRKVSWHSRWVYLALLANILIYLIVAMATRKRATVFPGLCLEHQQARNRAIFLGWLFSLLGLGLFFHGISREFTPEILVGFFTFLIAMIAGVLLARIVYATKIDDHFIRLRGCGEAFLANFPPLPPYYPS